MSNYGNIESMNSARSHSPVNRKHHVNGRIGHALFKMTLQILLRLAQYVLPVFPLQSCLFTKIQVLGTPTVALTWQLLFIILSFFFPPGIFSPNHLRSNSYSNLPCPLCDFSNLKTFQNEADLKKTKIISLHVKHLKGKYRSWIFLLYF